MSDIADDANATAELFLATALAARAAKSQPVEAADDGKCLYCGTAIEPGTRWCGTECRDDWEREQRLKARNGY